jgi:hypothetical protein
MFGPKNEDFEEFKRGRMRKHSYGEYVSSIPYMERIVDEENRKNLIRTVAKMIWQEYDQTAEFNPNGRHTSKAKSLLYNEGAEKNIAQELNKYKPIQIIRKAVDTGYLENFVLDEPWHFETFLDSDYPTTYPYQHSITITYSAQDKSIFFSREAKERLTKYASWAGDSEDFKNPNGILQQGQIRLGNRHVEHNHGQGSHRQGVFFGDLSVIRANYIDGIDEVGRKTSLYSKPVVIEAQIPSSWLYINTDTKYQSQQYHEDMNSIEELDNKFGNPEGLKEYVKEHRFPGLEFIVGNKPGLPLKYITGVWDPEKSKEPVFVPLTNPDGLSYAKMIKKDFPDLIQDNPKHGEDLSGINTDYCSICGTELLSLVGEEGQVCPLCHKNKEKEKDEIKGSQILSSELQNLEESIQDLRYVIGCLDKLSWKSHEVKKGYESFLSDLDNLKNWESTIRGHNPSRQVFETEQELEDIDTHINSYNNWRRSIEERMSETEKRLGIEMNADKEKMLSHQEIPQLEKIRKELGENEEELKKKVKDLSGQFTRISESQVLEQQKYKKYSKVEDFEVELIKEIYRDLVEIPYIDRDEVIKKLENEASHIEKEIKIQNIFVDIKNKIQRLKNIENHLLDQSTEYEFREEIDSYNRDLKNLKKDFGKIDVKIEFKKLEDSSKIPSLYKSHRETIEDLEAITRNIEANSNNLDQLVEEFEENIPRISELLSKFPLLDLSEEDYSEVKRIAQ